MYGKLNFLFNCTGTTQLMCNNPVELQAIFDGAKSPAASQVLKLLQDYNKLLHLLQAGSCMLCTDADGKAFINDNVLCKCLYMSA